MDFGDLLNAHGVEPNDTAYALHKPGPPLSRRVLSQLAEHEPELLNWYQSTHTRMQQATLAAHNVMASFIHKAEGEFVFCGLFNNQGHIEKTAAELDAMPQFQTLLPKFGPWTFQQEAADKGVLGRALFDLKRLDVLSDAIGRLVVSDPGGRNYMRLGSSTKLTVIEITRDVDLSPQMPNWRKLSLSKAELQAIPREWDLRLRDWRGIYLIVDKTDGAQYVGSAYGIDNLMARWQEHIIGVKGITAKLRHRNTVDFRFSILERVSPDMPAEDVIRLERTWMDRLQTIQYGLNS